LIASFSVYLYLLAKILSFRSYVYTINATHIHIFFEKEDLFSQKIGISRVSPIYSVLNGWHLINVKVKTLPFYSNILRFRLNLLRHKFTIINATAIPTTISLFLYFGIVFSAKLLLFDNKKIIRVLSELSPDFKLINMS
jgi:hypothetical protein